MEQNYEFFCRDCGCSTAIILPPKDMLNLCAVTCGFCESHRLTLTAYYKNIRDFVEQLQHEVRQSERRIQFLNGDFDEDDDFVHDDSLDN